MIGLSRYLLSGNRAVGSGAVSGVCECLKRCGFLCVLTVDGSVMRESGGVGW